MSQEMKIRARDANGDPFWWVIGSEDLFRRDFMEAVLALGPHDVLPDKFLKPGCRRPFIGGLGCIS